MENYARLYFAMNTLPHQFLNDAALAKRIAIIEFDQPVKPEDKDTDFAQKIIGTELSGIMNWIIEFGLKPLQATGLLDAPQCCLDAMERIRLENDPLYQWLDLRRYVPPKNTIVRVKRGEEVAYVPKPMLQDEAYNDFKDFCKSKGYVGEMGWSSGTFANRLKGYGYEVDHIDHSKGRVVNFLLAVDKPPVMEKVGSN